MLSNNVMLLINFSIPNVNPPFVGPNNNVKKKEKKAFV